MKFETLTSALFIVLLFMVVGIMGRVLLAVFGVWPL